MTGSRQAASSGTGFNSFVVNQNHLDAGGIEPPATWDELLDQCRKLKADGISEYP